jgi:O-acetyl-ADP-ribose deacetylase (regulator of RNase III)
MVANSANWAKMMDEAKRRQNVIGDGGQKMEINDRIIRAGGKVLTEKLAQLAEDKGGQLAIGDAVMTESFQIKENYFAKSECKLGIFFSEKIEEI